MSDRNEWRHYTSSQWRQLAHHQADEIERLRAEKYVVVSGDSLRNDNEALQAEIERLQREWDEDLKSMTLQWEVWEEADKAKDAEIERLQSAQYLLREWSERGYSNDWDQRVQAFIESALEDK